MPAKPLFEIASPLFPDLPKASPDSAESGGLRRARSRDRAAQWQSDLAKAYSYAAGRTRDPQEAAGLERAYEEALGEGADFTRYRRGSDFTPAPSISMDRNALARLRFKLHGIFRGSWAVKEKGKHCGVIQRTTLAVFDALVGLALKHGKVFPSLEGLAFLSKCSKNTVLAALKELQQFGFVTVHRRLKRVKTALGFKTVQDTNAYALHEPQGLGAMAARLFGGFVARGAASESNNWAARKPDFYKSERRGENSPLGRPLEPPLPDYWGQPLADIGKISPPLTVQF